MSAKRIWIMDGHNIIFAIPGLNRLQVSDRREEARQALSNRLERFAHARGQKVLIVFDGNDLPSNPAAIRRPMLDTIYTRRGEGVADDRILHEARSHLKQGRHVTVVTDDVNTLAGELPRGVDHLRVRAFWMEHIETSAADGGKPVEGDFSDVESEMVAQTEPMMFLPQAAARRHAVTRSQPSEEDARRERLRRKREEGRRRQELRLKRRSKPGRRR